MIILAVHAHNNNIMIFNRNIVCHSAHVNLVSNISNLTVNTKINLTKLSSKVLTQDCQITRRYLIVMQQSKREGATKVECHLPDLASVLTLELAGCLSNILFVSSNYQYSNVSKALHSRFVYQFVQ